MLIQAKRLKLTDERWRVDISTTEGPSGGT